MKKIKILFLLSVCFLIFTCDDNSVNPLDQKLQQNIIGTWKDNNNYTVTFFPDGSFIDTSKFHNPDSISPVYIYFIRKGRYTINDAVLAFKEFYFDTVITNVNVNHTSQSPLALISINNSVMRRKYFSQYDNIGRWGNDIWSTWESNGWYCSYYEDPFGEINNRYGTYKYTYQFFKDSSKCLFIYSFHDKVNDSTYSYKSLRDFKYTPPYLYIPPDSESPSEVKIRDNKMYFYSNYLVSDLIRVK